MTKLLILILVVSFDSFCTLSALSSNAIKVKALPVITICTTCSLFFTLGVLLSTLLKNVIPITLFNAISFAILILLGSYSIFSNMLKRYLTKRKNLYKNFKAGEVNFFIDIYLDESKADLDGSNSLNVTEAFLIGLMLSLDTFCAGITLSYSLSKIPICFILTFMVNLIFVLFGVKIGGKLNEYLKDNVSYFGGCVLIMLGISKLF